MQATEEMKALRLIGLVGRNLIREKLQNAREKDTYGERLRFDGLDPAVLAACVNAITADATCYSPALGTDGLEILLPSELVDSAEIQDRSVLFNGNAAAARNTPTENRILLFANAANAEAADTLKEIHPIREADLLEGGRAELWVEGLSDIYPTLAQDATLKSRLCALFIGFRREMRRSLRVTARYLLRVTDALVAGTVIGEAASEALPELRLPRFLSAMPRHQLETPKVWEKAFSSVKQIPANIFIANERPVDLSLEKLKENLELIRAEETVSEQTLEVYEALVQEIPGREWDELLRLNWLSDALCRFVSLQPATVSRKTLGLETRDFFEANANSRMDDAIAGTGISIREFLDQFAENDKLKNDEEFKRTARSFYSEIEDIDLPAKLRSKWEKLLFSAPIEGDDFIDCLLRATLMLSRLNRSQKKSFQHPALLVVCQTSTQTFFTATNCRLLHFFSAMYRGLETECGEFIRFAFKNLDFKKTGGLNPLFHFENALDALPKYKGKNKPKPCKSDKKDALQLKFFAYLVERDASVSAAALKQMPNVRLTWRLAKNCAAFGFAADLHLVANRRPTVLQNALGAIVGKNFRQTNSRGRMAEVSLKDMSSLGLNRLALVDHNTSNHNRNLKKCFDAALASQQASSSGIDIETIKEKWDDFRGAFRAALQDFEETGLAAPSIPRMHERYIELLKAATDAAPRSDAFGRQVLSILLSIGVFSFVDPTSAHAIVAPWNPVRLYEMHRRFTAKTALIRAIAEDPENAPCQDDETLLGALEREGEQLKPSIVVVPDAGLAIDADDGDFRCSEILSATEHVSGYSLYSRVAGKNSQSTDADSVAVSELTDAARSYLELVPEAGDSLSVLLPDAEAKEFPLQAIEALAEKLPENERIIVTAGGAEGYSSKIEKKLYGGLAEGASHTEVLRQESLLAPSLLSRTELRAAPTSDRGRGSGLAAGDRRYDIAFLGRFFTQTANIGWVEMPKAQTRSTNPYGFFAALQPPERRIFILGRDTTSTTLLCGSELSDASHAYLDAARILSDSGRRAQGPDPQTFSYPCLFVDCDSGRIKAEIERLHNAARWVTTGSNLIDRRQLLKSGIKIVRYKRNADGRTCITSSSAPTSLTHRVEERIAEIAPAMTGDPAKKAADAVIEAALRISGYVALRSARQDSNANEVLGLALSHWIAKAEALELCRKAGEKPLATASFLIDDYASCFKKDKRLADLLRLTFAEKEGRLKLHLQVTEAKFRQMSTLSADKTHSAEQAKATADVLYDALASATSAPLKPVWLARLSELAMNIETSDILENSDPFAIIKLARKVREGDFDLTIDAVSHVFVHDSDHEPEYFRLDNNATGRKLSQTVIYQRDIAKLLKKGKELEFSDIDEIFADTSYAPCFNELSLTPDWKWADGLSLEFLGKPSAPIKRTESEREEAEEEDPSNDEVEPATPAVHSQKTPPEPPHTPPAPPVQPAQPAQPVRHDVQIPQVARVAECLAFGFDDDVLKQRLQEALFAICEPGNESRLQAGLAELGRSIFRESFPADRKNAVLAWLNAAGIPFLADGTLKAGALPFSSLTKQYFRRWKMAVLLQGSLEDYRNPYAAGNRRPAGDVLKKLLAPKDEPATPTSNKSTPDSGAGAEPNRTETDTRPIRPRIKAEVKQSAAEGERWLPQVARAAAAFANEWDDATLTQRLQEAILAICETKRLLAVKAGLKELHRAIFADSVPVNQKANICKWLKAAGFDFSALGEVAIDRLGFNFFEEPGFSAWKTALLAQGTVGDYGSAYSAWKCHPAADALKDFLSKKSEPPKTDDERWMPQVNRALVALGNEFDDDKLTQQLRTAVFAICETKNNETVRAGMNMLYHAACAYSLSKDRKINVLKWFRDAGFDFSDAGEVELGRLGLNFFENPDFGIWKAALLVQGTVGDYGNPHAAWRRHPAVAVLTERKSVTPPASGENGSPQTQNAPRQSRISRANTRWTPQVCRAETALVNENEDDILTKRLQEAVFAICETKQTGEVKTGMEALYCAVCSDSVAYGRKVSVLEWLKAAGFDFSTTGKVKLARLGSNFFGEPDFSVWKSALLTQGSIGNYGNTASTGKCHPAADALKDFLNKNNWATESQGLVPPAVETELEKIHDDRWVPQVCRTVVALANELDTSNLTQQLRATVLAICETKDNGAVRAGIKALYRAACANSVSIDRKINILKWLRAAGFDFSDAGDVSLERLGPNFFEDPGFRKWKMAFRTQGSIEDYGNPYAAGNRHPAAEALREFLAKQPPAAPAAPRLEATSIVLEDHDQRAYAPDFEKLVREKGGDFSYSPEREAWAKVATQNLQTFLVAHDIPARVKRSTLTPNGCLVCFEGEERLTTKAIEKLKEVILSTKAIKILFAEPAPGEFRILFNDGTNSRETVSLWKAWSQRSVDRTNGLNLSFLVGLKEADGQLLYLNPEKFEPHTLIAGGTGSGKTALVQTLILDMAATNPSSMLKIYLIDPKKGVDFAPIKQLPHMAEAPVTELADIPALFEKLYKIMEERYALFSVAGVNKLSTYNAKVPRGKQLPALFVIHDELAFCMQDDGYKKAVPPLMIQLATKCRAAGIYLILIAQRPDKDVVPVQVRDNLGNRLILKVPTGTSEFALGEKGAEDLLGKGHMAAKMGGQGGHEYAQVPFLSDQNEVIQEVVDAIKAADKQWH